MKTILDTLEFRKPVALSMVTSLEGDKGGMFRYLSEPLRTESPFTLIGISFQMKEGMLMQAGMEYSSEDAARKARDDIRKSLEPAHLAGVVLGFRVDFDDPLPGSGGAMPGSSGSTGSGSMSSGTMSSAGSAGSGSAGSMSSGSAGTGGGTIPGSGGGLLDKLADAATPNGSIRISVAQQGPIVEVAANCNLSAKMYENLPNLFGPGWSLIRAQVDMAMARPHLQELAAAGMTYRQAHKQFPRGTAEREPSATRANRPWPPDQRVSWMVELLPYLGYEDIYKQVDRTLSWQDDKNVNPSITVIPAFVDPRNQMTWHVPYRMANAPPGFPTFPRGATHFVGISGVGLDAAEYPLNDPTVAKKLGMFGYDRITKPEDITDGLSNTIMMIQVPPPYQGPWMAGGGSTVRGVPETKSVQPFVSTQANGKRGTMVLMADGSVRFVSENISDEAFKAMATMQGSDQVDVNAEAPKVPASGQSTLKAEPMVPAAPPKEEKKEPPPGDKPATETKPEATAPDKPAAPAPNGK